MADEPQDQPFDKEAFVAGIKAKYNGAADVALSVLGQENFELRKEKRELKSKLPKEDSVILTADEAKIWKAYQDLGVSPKDLKPFIELGKTPDELKTAVEKVPELEKETKELKQSETYREVAAAYGYKPAVLKRLMADYPDAVFEFKTEKDDKEQEHTVALIRNAGDDKDQPFDKFAEEHFADFLPALKVEADQTKQQPKNPMRIDPPPANPGDPTPADERARTASAAIAHGSF